MEALPAAYVNVVLNAGADADGGSKIVLVDDGHDGRKYVASTPALFAALLARHAAQLKVIKLKGRVDDAAAVAAALRAALMSGRVSALCFKAAELPDDAAARTLAEAVWGGLAAAGAPAAAGCMITHAKKATAAASSFAGAEALAQALCARVSPAQPGAHAAAAALKLKAKLSAAGGLQLLADDAAIVASLGAPVHVALGGELGTLVAGPPTSVKVRGPLSGRIAAALRRLVAGVPTLQLVKFVRYSAPEAGSAGSIAAAICAGAAEAISSGPASAGRAPVRVVAKRKGGEAEAVEVPLGAGAAAAEAAVASLLGRNCGQLVPST